jgi:DNA-binding response OmpR family regulator
MQHLCLIIERDASFARRLLHELPAFGFKPYGVDSCRAALSMLQLWRFDTVLLDAAAFGENTANALRALRKRVSAPVVLLAPAHDEATQLAGLEAGARDVVTLPTSTRLLAARLRRLVESGAEPDDAPAMLSVGPLTMDARRGSASIDDRPLPLTAHQFDLLYLLATRLGQFVHREAIARALRSPSADAGRSADVHIYRIRKKLRALDVTALRLDTVHGRGYCLTVDTPEPHEDGDAVDAATWDRAAQGLHAAG